MNIIKKTSIMLFNIMLSTFLHAQDFKKEEEEFKSLTQFYNTVYTPQKDFVYQGEDFYRKFYPTKGKFSPANFAVVNNKKDMLILMDFSLIADNGLYNMKEKEIDSLANVRGMEKFKANFFDPTIKSQPFVIDESMLKEINASVVTLFNIKVDNPYKGKYKYIKAANILRKDLGLVTLYYLAIDSTQEVALNKVIKDTWGIIKFKDDSLYNPPPTAINNLVGKFRHLRPIRNPEEDSLAHIRTEKVAYAMTLSLNAEQAFQQKNYEDAISSYKKILELSPSINVLVYRRLSAIYLKVPDPDSALFYAKKLMEIDATNLDNQMVMANYYASIGELDKGIEVYSKNLGRSDELNSQTFFYMASFYLRNKSYDKAIEKFKIVNEFIVKQKKPNGLILFSIAESYSGLATQNNSEHFLNLAKDYYLKAKEAGYEIPK